MLYSLSLGFAYQWSHLRWWCGGTLAYCSRHWAGNSLIPSLNPTCVQNKVAPCFQESVVTTMVLHSLGCSSCLMVEYIWVIRIFSHFWCYFTFFLPVCAYGLAYCLANLHWHIILSYVIFSIFFLIFLKYFGSCIVEVETWKKKLLWLFFQSCWEG